MESADNRLIYAYSKFLDPMVKEWAALVADNYKWVMPLPVRKKWGFSYLFQPFLTPMLGVFGNGITEEIINKFLAAIPSRFKLWDYNFNPGNKVSPEWSRLFERSNYVLSLNKPYEQLAAAYSENLRRNIGRAIKNRCIVRNDIDPGKVISIAARELPAVMKVERGGFDAVQRVYDLFAKHSRCYGAYDSAGRLLSAAIFLGDERRSYYWLVGNDAAAKDAGASPLLIDQFIKDHAGQQRVLDFEGSDIKGVAEFYRRFGATRETYQTIYRNRLPVYLKWARPLPKYYLGLGK